MSTVSMSSTSTPRLVMASWVVIALAGAAIVVACVLASIYGGVGITDVVIGS